MEADEHLYDKKGARGMYRVTLANQLKDNPDFMLDLGDIFGNDHNPFTITSSSGSTLLTVSSLGNFNLATLSPSSLVFTDAARNLTSTGVAGISQDIFFYESGGCYFFGYFN